MSDCQLTRRRRSAGYGPVVDLAKDPVNAALVSEVRILSSSQPIMLTIECPILAVLGGRGFGYWCLPWARVGSRLPASTVLRH